METEKFRLSSGRYCGSLVCGAGPFMAAEAYKHLCGTVYVHVP